MVRVVKFEIIGGFEVIEWYDVDLLLFGKGEVWMCNIVVGLNYIDVYFCKGIYLIVLLSGLGSEVVGVVMVVGDGVIGFVFGDCVGIFGFMCGVYVIECNVFVIELFYLFDLVDDWIVVVLMLKGVIVEFLIECCVKVEFG